MKIIQRHLSPLLLAIIVLFAGALALSPLFAEQVSADFVCTITNQCSSGTDATACNNACKLPDGTQIDCVQLTASTCETKVPGVGPNGENPFSSWSNLVDLSVGFVLKLLNYLLYGISTVLERLVALSAFLLEMAIDVSSAPFSDITILKEGWKIVRDVMNSFFVLILFIIAIATILQLESYAWKQLLPWFIIVALLVNFSFVLSGVVIDFSNVLGRTFFDKLNSPKKLSDNIATAFDINNINNIALPGCQPSITNPTTGTAGTIASYAKGWSCASGATDAAQKLYLAYEDIYNVKISDIDTLAKYLFVLTLRVIMLFLMIFPLLAGAVLMIVRTVMLMIVIILAPAAFTAYILPGTRFYANEWWSKLFSLSFFFPIYLFLLYIAINYGIQIGNALKFTGTQLGGTFENLATIFNFLTMVAFMFLALSVARQSGIYGGAVAVQWAQTAGKWMRGYAGRVARRAPARYIAEPLARSPGVQKFLTSRFVPFGNKAFERLQRAARGGEFDEQTQKQATIGLQLAPAYQAAYYRKLGTAARRAFEGKAGPEKMAEMLHYTDDQKLRGKIREGAFATLPEEQREDMRRKLKIAYADREANRQSTGQVVDRFNRNVYSEEEENEIFDEMKTDRRAKVLMRSTRDIAELEKRMIKGIGKRDVREIERTYEEITRTSIDLDPKLFVQKFNQLSEMANKKLFDIINPRELERQMAGFADAATLAGVTLTPEQQEQKKFLNKMHGLGVNRNNIEIRKIAGGVRPSYWQDLGFASQRQLVESLSPAEAATMTNEEMAVADVSQHFDAGQLEAIGRSHRITPETRRQVRSNIESWIAAQRAPGPYPPLTPEESARYVRLKNYLKRIPAFQ